MSLIEFHSLTHPHVHGEMSSMKLYTRSGDDGTTGLFGGQRVGKDDIRVEAYGCVDELNAAVGLAAAACDENSLVTKRMHEILRELQSRLFDLGADLATPANTKHEAKTVRITKADVAALESMIDEIDGGNVPMTSFVLPGGTELAARLHLARTIGRRAERRVVSLMRMQKMNQQVLILLNRISDLLFAMARRANREAGVTDVPWRGAKNS